MKKLCVFFLTLVMMISFIGCQKSDGGSTKKLKSAEETQKVSYRDDQVLFMAQDRCDIEDDRYTVYCYNHKGELLSSSDPSITVGYYAENGLAPATDRNSGKMGFVDREGVFQISPEYEAAAAFSKDNNALVGKKIGNDDNGVIKYGYINAKGEEVTPFIYDKATSFYHCGYALAMIEKETKDEDGYTKRTPAKHIILDKTGKEIVQIDLEQSKMQIYTVCHNCYVCLTENDEMILFDYQNNEVGRISEAFSDETYYTVDEDDYFCKYSLKDQAKNRIERFLVEKKEKFNGKKFVNDKTFQPEDISEKHVATTRSGLGLGIEKNGKTLIPFEYDELYAVDDYYVAVRYTGDSLFNQTTDIYDKLYHKTADRLPYAIKDRYQTYGAKESALPNGYFQIMLENEDYSEVYGIIDYRGNVIVEPVFGRGIALNTYEEAGFFDWW